MVPEIGHSFEEQREIGERDRGEEERDRGEKRERER